MWIGERGACLEGGPWLVPGMAERNPEPEAREWRGRAGWEGKADRELGDSNPSEGRLYPENVSLQAVPALGLHPMESRCLGLS